MQKLITKTNLKIENLTTDIEKKSCMHKMTKKTLKINAHAHS